MDQATRLREIMKKGQSDESGQQNSIDGSTTPEEHGVPMGPTELTDLAESTNPVESTVPSESTESTEPSERIAPEEVDDSKVQSAIVVSDSPVFNSTHNCRLITISSGKGGVGKTNFTVNLAIALSKLGRKVAIIDADLGLANVDVTMGIVPKYTLLDVVRQGKTLHEIIAEGPMGIKVVSGGSGVKDLVDMPSQDISKLIEGLESLNQMAEYILIDTGAGISNSVMAFLKAADDIIVVVTPDPTAITDAYALIKNIDPGKKTIKVVVNRVESNKEGSDVFEKINMATMKFLKKELENLGYIYEDSNVKKAVRSQKPFLLAYPSALASKGIDLIAYNLEHNSRFINQVSTFNKFLNNLFGKF